MPQGPVQTLILEKGSTRVRRSNERDKRDELWQGDGFNPLEPDEVAVPVYLRLGQSNALVAELVCASLARSLQLPVPDIYLVIVPPGHLPRSKLASKTEQTLCVGTRDIGGKSFVQLLNEEGQAATRLLQNWPELGKVAAFDEWLANPDRNLGNLVYAAQTLHIIDHAEAFGGSTRAMFPLSDLTEMQFSNILADLIHECFVPDHVHSLLEQVQQWLRQTASAMDVPTVVQLAGADSWTAEAERTELVDFISERLTLTHALLCQRMGHPQLTLRAPAS